MILCLVLSLERVWLVRDIDTFEEHGVRRGEEGGVATQAPSLTPGLFHPSALQWMPTGAASV